jgi:hypothetical protein
MIVAARQPTWYVSIFESQDSITEPLKMHEKNIAASMHRHRCRDVLQAQLLIFAKSGDATDRPALQQVFAG